MLIKRLLSFVTLVVIGGTAHASTYKLEFTTFTGGFLGSSYFTSEPSSPGLIGPETRLVEIIFDAAPGAGVLADESLFFAARFFSEVPTLGKISQVNLYNYGVGPVQYDPYAASPPAFYNGEVADSSADGSVDSGTLTIFDLMAPSQNSTPDPATGLPFPGQPLISYSLNGEFNAAPDSDFLSFGGLRHQGNWTISEVSAVPIPAAIWLFGTSLLGLLGFSKRRKAI